MNNIEKTKFEKTKFIRRWIDALRSGDYKQCSGRLRRPSENKQNNFNYCCLGVACNLFDSEKWNGEYYELDDYDRHNRWFPEKLEKLLDVDIPTLITMNDDGTTFDEIADYIERNYLE